MRAIVYQRYGPPEVLELEDIPKPTPTDHEVLIKVRATTVTAADWRLRSLSAPKGFGILMRLAMGPSRPRRPILGAELSGEIEAIGKDVSRFKVGDQVFAGVLATYVEYKCMREDGALALKPANRATKKRPRFLLAARRLWPSSGRERSKLGRASSSTVPPARWGRPPCSSPSTMAPG